MLSVVFLLVKSGDPYEARSVEVIWPPSGNLMLEMFTFLTLSLLLFLSVITCLFSAFSFLILCMLKEKQKPLWMINDSDRRMISAQPSVSCLKE